MFIKKYVVINSILTFGLCFLFHFAYDLFDNFIFALIFPVNESIFEHIKLIFTSYVFSSLFLSKYYKNNTIINNLFFSTLMSYLLCIFVFLIVWLPLYFSGIESMIFTIIWLFVSTIVSQIVVYKLYNKNINNDYNKISVVFIILLFIIFGTFTYIPLKNPLFIDPQTKSYGIP